MPVTPDNALAAQLAACIELLASPLLCLHVQHAGFERISGKVLCLNRPACQLPETQQMPLESGQVPSVFFGNIVKEEVKMKNGNRCKETLMLQLASAFSCHPFSVQRHTIGFEMDLLLYGFLCNLS